MGFSIKISQDYYHLKKYIESIPFIFEQEGTTIYNLRNIIKVFTAPDGKDINVKQYCIPIFINRLIYSLGLREPKGLRAWEYPSILNTYNISTPKPIAYIEERKWGLIRHSYLITEQCAYTHTLYEMGNASRDEYEPMAIAIAQLAANMHNNNIMHKDFTPGNILWDIDADGKYQFSIVDINRMYFGTIDFKRGINNLKKLWGPKKFFQLIIKEYATIRGFNSELAEKYALEKRSKFWHRYQKRHNIPFNLEL